MTIALGIGMWLAGIVCALLGQWVILSIGALLGTVVFDCYRKDYLLKYKVAHTSRKKYMKRKVNTRRLNMNMESRRKSLGIYKLVFSVIGLGLVSILVYQFVGGMFEGSKYRIQALLITTFVYIIIAFVLLHRSLAEVFGKLIWGKVVHVQRRYLAPDDEAVKGLKMKVNVEGKVRTFRYTYSQFSDDAEGGSVGHYVAVYKFGPCMSVDVRRRREWEENE